MLEPPRATWVIVRIRPSGSDTLIEVRDSRGRRGRMGVDPEGQRHGPEAVHELLRQAAEPFLVQRGLHRRTLPLFVDLAEGPEQFEPEPLLAQLPLDPEIWPLVRPLVLARPRWPRARAPLRLPLGILAVRSWDAFTELESHWWFTDPTIREHGLEVGQAADPMALAAALRQGRQHVLVARSEDWPWLLPILVAVSAARRPRLVVGLDHWPGQLDEAAAGFAAAAPGSALLLHRADRDPPAPQLLDQLILGIVHDLALHDAAGRGSLLLADPPGNQALRLADSFRAEVEQVLARQAAPLPGDVEGYLARTGGARLKHVAEPLREAAVTAEAVDEALEQALATDVSFRHEGTGLGPWAHAKASLDRAAPAADAVAERMAEVAASPKVREHLRQHQARQADVALLRDTRELFEGLGEAAIYDQLYVAPDTALAAGRHYHLQLRVGRPLPLSLLTEAPPPLDPLLPEREGGHELEAVVFEGDFTLLARRSHRFLLPSLGASPVVTFPLRAPAEVGPAGLRLGLYFRDHMLQSFRLTAAVEARERAASGERLLAVDLDFSRTGRLADLDRFGPRRLAVGVNLDPGGATHTFMVKQGKVARPVKLPEAVLGDQIKAFRDLLQTATLDEFNRSAFTAARDSKPFDAVVRRLAQQGGALRRALFTRHPDLAEVLKQVRQLPEGSVLQFVRHDPNYAFPWAVIYDFKLPDDLPGRPPAPVCRGAQNGAPCGHTAQDRVYCIQGFWGVRHRVEELMAFKAEAAPRLATRGQARVLLVPGYQDAHTSALDGDLKIALGASRVVPLAAGDRLLDQVWNRASGPAVVVVIGHLETRDLPGEPPGPRVVIEPGIQWLREKEVTERTEDDRPLAQPEPIVLLLACGSAGVQLETLNHLFTSLVRAGTAAVVGAETLTFTRLVSPFARDLTVALCQGETLGEALRQARGRLLAAGNPLGFVFTAFGDADLQLPT